MQYGLIKTAVAVPDLQVADCLYNTSALLKLIKEAEDVDDDDIGNTLNIGMSDNYENDFDND